MVKAPAHSMLGWVYTLQTMKTLNWVGDIVDGLRQDRDGWDKVKPSHLESDLGEHSYLTAQWGGIYKSLSIPF